MNEFFSFRKDPQGNFSVFYETFCLGYVFTVGEGIWCADCVRGNGYHQYMPKRMQGMLIGFVDKEHAAFYLYRLWVSFNRD